MRTVSMHLHQYDDGHFRLVTSLWEDGQPCSTLVDEESVPMPLLNVSEVWAAAADMATQALEARWPEPGLAGPYYSWTSISG